MRCFGAPLVPSQCSSLLCLRLMLTCVLLMSPLHPKATPLAHPAGAEHATLPARAHQETLPTSCSIVRKWGCFRELDCGANVTRRCVGGAMLSGSITTQEACACACGAQGKGYTMGGLEEDRCFCAHDNAPPSTKCGAANASTTCPNGVGGDCSVEVFSFSCTTTASSSSATTAATPSEFSAPVVCPSPPPPPPPPPPQQPIRPGFVSSKVRC